MSKDGQHKVSFLKKCRKLVTKKNVLIVVLVAILGFQYFQSQDNSLNLSFLHTRESSLIEEIGQLKENYTKVGGDMNEIRQYLKLPLKEYQEIEINSDDTEDGSNKDQVQLAMFKYIDSIASSKTVQDKLSLNRTFLDDLLVSKDFSEFLIKEDLVFSPTIRDEDNVVVKITTKDGDSLVTYTLDNKTGDLVFQTMTTKKPVDSSDFVAFKQELMTFLTDNKADLIANINTIEKLKKTIASAVESAKVQEILKTKELVLSSDYSQSELKLTYSIFSKANELVGEIVLDTKTSEISLIDKNAEDMKIFVTDMIVSLPPFLKGLDSRSIIEQKAGDSIDSFKKTLEDKGFISLLSKGGLSFKAPKEDDDRIYYTLHDQKGELVSTFIIEKATGVVTITDDNGNKNENLLFFDPDLKKKPLNLPKDIPRYTDTLVSDKNSFNVLIAGKNGSLLDTMIFVHVNEKKQEINMISIPRDLYYNGRKINAFASMYGMPEMKKVLSQISGFKLDKYIVIEMYTFIDVIDLIGGVDVHLSKALIDPTYKTIDNGVEGTLHYEPGDYHLGGKEALRVARSRHSSSDFDRAARQQIIIEALQSKAKNMGFGDIDTIYEIIKVVLAKTETDISFDEAVAYYFKYQNYKIVSNSVISSGNILYVPPYVTQENCNVLIASAQANGLPTPSCVSANHAYTLLPRDDDWDIIKWFFRKEFK